MTTAFDTNFNALIGSLYDRGILPPIAVVDHIDDEREYLRRTGMTPVLSEDESEDCPVFGNWGVYYEFAGWAAYRRIMGTGNEFQLMVMDVLGSAAWSPETVKWIGIVNGLVKVQELYADKYGHYPADMNKFIKSYVRYGEDTVLRADVY